MEMTLTEKVKNSIVSHALFDIGDSVLVAVSGGADSVCLLDVLVSIKDEFKLSIFVAHVNHLLRGEEADRDEDFVRSLCNTYGLPFYSASIDVKKLACEKKISIEEAGRLARYNFFYELQEKHCMTKIATAHNKDDNAETVCMRFIRGTSVKGLGGIPVKNDTGVVRPLLCISRKEIEDYLKERNLSYVTDSSNLTDDYTRNKVRHSLIPQITKEFNENFIDTLSQNIEEYQETECFLRKCCDDAFFRLVSLEDYGISVNTKDLLREDIVIAKRVIKKIVTELTGNSCLNATAKHIYGLAERKDSASLCIADDITVYNTYGSLYFVKESALNQLNHTVTIEEESGDVSFSDKHVLYIDASYHPEKITVRTKKPGDKIFLGNCGHKKVQDVLTDEKVPVFLRDRIPILLYENEIIWVCGIRDNPVYRAVPGKPYIKLTYQKEKDHA